MILQFFAITTFLKDVSNHTVEDLEFSYLLYNFIPARLGGSVLGIDSGIMRFKIIKNDLSITLIY